MASEHPHQVSTRTPARKRLENALIALFLVFQIGVPLHYYLAERSYDERFSWRMFSTLRLRDCKIRVTETLDDAARTVRDVTVQQDVQVAWVRLLERMRSAVIERYLARRCGTPHVQSVHYESDCEDTDGQPLPPVQRNETCAHEPAEEHAP
jgi:hypothetical protein